MQYHYLDRPYRLEALTALKLPEPVLIQEESMNYSIYKIRIKPGILFQPHPCFAKDSQGNFVYHDLTYDQISQIKTFSFFTSTGTRELTAYDYAFQIKRLAHPQKHSPISGLMSKHIMFEVII